MMRTWLKVESESDVEKVRRILIYGSLIPAADDDCSLIFKRPTTCSYHFRFPEELLHSLLDTLELEMIAKFPNSEVIIRNVTIDGFQRNLWAATEGLKSRFYRIIASLPCLENLRLINNGHQALEELTLILRSGGAARGLKTLDCGKCSLDGTEQQYMDFANAIRDHPALEVVRFSKSSNVTTRGRQGVGERYTGRATIIDPVIRAFRSIPNLSTIGPLGGWITADIQQYPSELATTISALADLCGHPKLTDLSFDEFPLLGNVGLQPIMESICHQQNLQNLWLRIDLQDDNQCLQLVQFIGAAGHSSLQSLGLSVGCIAPEFQPRVSVARVRRPTAGVLRRQRLQNEEKKQQNFPKLIEALKHNSTLVQLTICSGSRGPAFFPNDGAGEALVHMLEQHNMTLTEIEFKNRRATQEEDFPSWFTNMRYWLALNGAGRKALLQGGTPRPQEEWINALATVSDYVPALFHLLSHNPSLCNTTYNSNNSRKRKRKTATTDNQEEDEEEPSAKIHQRSIQSTA